MKKQFHLNYWLILLDLEININKNLMYTEIDLLNKSVTKTSLENITSQKFWQWGNRQMLHA